MRVFRVHTFGRQAEHAALPDQQVHAFITTAMTTFDQDVARTERQQLTRLTSIAGRTALAVGDGEFWTVSGTVAADGSVAVDATARLASVPKIKCRTAGLHGDEVEVIFRPDEELSERVIFPITPAQANGIEDARFVEFDDDGRKTFYATYTAYSGRAIRSELLQTTDFQSFRMGPLGGSAVGSGRSEGLSPLPARRCGRPDCRSVHP